MSLRALAISRRRHLIGCEVASSSRFLLSSFAMTAGLAACGQSQTVSGQSVSGVSVQFVGNSTCPTSGQQPYYAPSPPNVNGLPPVGEAIDEMPHAHVAPPAQVTYNHDPPTSGCHYSLGYGDAPTQTGAYDKVVPPEYWVHNLEHGYADQAKTS